MSSFLSAAADTPENPMSEVEPSPPHTTTIVSRSPRSRNAALIPDASAAAEANGVRWTQTPNRIDRKHARDDRPARGRDNQDDLRLRFRSGESAEHVPHADGRSAACAGAVAGKEELLLRDDLLEPGGRHYIPTGT